MEKHLRLLAVLYIVYGGLHMFGGLVGWILIRWFGLVHGFVPGRMTGLFLIAHSLITVLIVFATVVSAAGIVGAIGLLNKQRWARVLVLVLSFLNLIHFPLGTALGAYGIWVLMNDETDRLFPQSPASSAQQQGVAGS